MPAFGHIAVGLLARRAVPTLSRAQRIRVMLVGVIASIAPDLDLAGMPFHPAEGVWWGHRGASHSLLAAAGIALAVGLLGPRIGVSFRRLALVALALVGSHLALDCMNVGSRGVPWLWPVIPEPFGVVWQPIPALVRTSDLFTLAGLRVFLAEALLFAPVAVWGLAPLRRGAGSATP